ncbi:LOW QUALITY PROTEIN: hypothetical protein PHMEG_0006110 [Phytophthora megakarya]|uniref:Uncharacterized protein n=1 Tax=Phytophthora megakarya TaxID=4795 RepID=A0A225WPS5_9STRA|nr:LOW QUALITY PROTEIN: hypothetical protein PHMEG_0006110 [Phytophthora megakarya]
MVTLTELSAHCKTEEDIAVAAAKVGLTSPVRTNLSDDDIDIDMVESLTQLAIYTKIRPPEFVRLIRGQTEEESRPNKDLYELRHSPSIDLLETPRRWNNIVQNGIVPEWLPHRPSHQIDR